MATSYRHPIMDIIGHEVHQVRFAAGGSAARLIFLSGDNQLSEIAIVGMVKLVRGADETLLKGALMGKHFNPRELAPLLNLLTGTVTDIAATECENDDGSLEPALSISFSNRQTLVIGGDTMGNEGWSFRHGKGVVKVI
ncbi:hypothetical protein CCAX7_60630 [Capsulimonas corticalis]|uniref:Uncharacterized protein n=1 Tax=Capsulimonas corticalis TaxID=2219043 RepID=A0A402CVZ6_9BACT|nr:hypothetical protein [Capsulimonas corticalis]BDI34012.1 hypothetical protein CCAX7_60630 [Capsulimonas corticalis]